MKHFILTRFTQINEKNNIYTNGKIKDPERYLSDRIKLFEKYTLPSVKAQTNQNFKWILAFTDKEKHLVEKYRSGNIIPIIGDCKSYMNSLNLSGWVITTRIDSDDYVTPDFIDLLQKEADEITEVLDVHGLQYDINSGKWYNEKRKSANSMFLSLVEKVDDKYRDVKGNLIERHLKTCYYTTHSCMPHFFHCRVISRDYKYCQIIHKTNMTTRNREEIHIPGDFKYLFNL